jgi:hypothetical protein
MANEKAVQKSDIPLKVLGEYMVSSAAGKPK